MQVSEQLLFNAKWAIILAIHTMTRTSIIQLNDDDDVHFVLDQHT